MIILKISLKQKKSSHLSINYKYYLREICKKLIAEGKYSKEIKDKLNISPLFCSNYEIKGSSIVFKDKINWYISSKEYDPIMFVVQKLFHNGILKLGNAEFEICSLETKKSLTQEEISLQRAVVPTITSTKELTSVNLMDKYINLNNEEFEENFIPHLEYIHMIRDGSGVI